MQIKNRGPRQRQRPPRPSSAPSGGSRATGDAPGARPSTPSAGGRLLVHHGIHSGSWPVAGLSVAQARRMLSPFMNIAPEAVAVIRGEQVEDEDERVLQDRDQLLSFVPSSSVKGKV